MLCYLHITASYSHTFTPLIYVMERLFFFVLLRVRACVGGWTGGDVGDISCN